MKEYYVSYHHASRLYMLGFDEDVQMAYYVHAHMNKAELVSRTEAEEVSRGCDGTDIYPAPRLDQAQRWFREQWDIYIEPSYQYPLRFEVYIRSARFGLCMLNVYRQISYEASLSAGIDMALNFLEKKLREYEATQD